MAQIQRKRHATCKQSNADFFHAQLIQVSVQSIREGQGRVVL